MTADLRRQGMPRERALACAVRLLDLGFFRVGGEVYAEENESFGLATVRREHVSIEDGEVVFDFPAKSGQRRVQSIRDPPSVGAIEAMRRRRSGPDDLLAWRDGREWRDVRSDDVNSYIQEKIGERLLGQGLPHLARHRAGRGRAGGRAGARLRGGREAVDPAAIERVAEALGNTPAVCRRSYVDPRVIERFREGETISPRASVGGRMTARARAKLEREVRRLVA